MNALRVIRTGLRDGLDQPYEFNVGMTYDKPARQWLYDWASRAGQKIARVRENAK